MIDRDRLAALGERRIGQENKSFPAWSWGLTVREFLARSPRLSQLQTPIPVLDASRLSANQAAFRAWSAERGVGVAPHGKTTMAPQLWALHLEDGAWGITVATPWQAQLARAFGVKRLMLANELTDPVALAWLAEELAEDPGFEFWCWADDVQAARRAAEAFSALPNGRVNVLLDVGTRGGRTGARSDDAALAVAREVAASAPLRLAGVAAWEGVFAAERSDADAAETIRAYLRRVVELHAVLGAEGLYDGPVLLTAGGSAYPDLVIEALAPLSDERTSVLIRSGCYLIHDDGLYSRTSPLREGRVDADDDGAASLHPALQVTARVLSAPEPGLVLLDAGRRDLSFDAGLPVLLGRSDGAALSGEVTALNDQHAFVRVDGGELRPGDTVRLGISHPCTTFDKWRLIPVVDDLTAEDPTVVDVVRTFF